MLMSFYLLKSFVKHKFGLPKFAMPDTSKNIYIGNKCKIPKIQIVEGYQAWVWVSKERNLRRKNRPIRLKRAISLVIITDLFVSRNRNLNGNCRNQILYFI